MEKEERISLVVKLYEKMQFAKIIAEGQTISEWNNKDFVDNTSQFNPRFVSKKQYFQVVEFRKFLIENPNLSDEEIREILSSNNKFSFLRKLDDLIPDFFEELKLHGVGYVVMFYVNKKYGREALSVPRI